MTGEFFLVPRDALIDLTLAEMGLIVKLLEMRDRGVVFDYEKDLETDADRDVFDALLEGGIIILTDEGLSIIY